MNNNSAQKRIKDPVSGFTHLGGALLSITGLVLLLLAARGGGAARLTAVSVFGVSMIALYTASTLYHLVVLSERGTRILRRIDHMMIFVLIAGTYTPICLVALRGAWGWSLLAVVWGLALGGIVLKLLWLSAPRWLSTSLYLAMGWLVVVATVPLVRTLQAGGLFWLGAGGAAYTVGAVIYGLRLPRLAVGVFGFHELFHLFVLAGTASHFWMVYRHIVPLN